MAGPAGFVEEGDGLVRFGDDGAADAGVVRNQLVERAEPLRGGPVEDRPAIDAEEVEEETAERQRLAQALDIPSPSEPAHRRLERQRPAIPPHRDRFTVEDQLG